MPDKSVKILGTGPSLSLLKINPDDEIWTVSDMDFPQLLPHITLFFGMHDHDCDKFPNNINQNNYPLNEIVKEFGSAYFTNSISYMIAYAVYKGYKKIELYGVDMSARDEYINQRGSVMYWIGFARAKGVDVFLASGIDKPWFLYGYEPGINIRNKIKQLKDFAETGKNIATSEDEKNQFIGMIHALNLISMEI